MYSLYGSLFIIFNRYFSLSILRHYASLFTYSFYVTDVLCTNATKKAKREECDNAIWMQGLRLHVNLLVTFTDNTLIWVSNVFILNFKLLRKHIISHKKLEQCHSDFTQSQYINNYFTIFYVLIIVKWKCYDDYIAVNERNSDYHIGELEFIVIKLISVAIENVPIVRVYLNYDFNKNN